MTWLPCRRLKEAAHAMAPKIEPAPRATYTDDKARDERPQFAASSWSVAPSAQRTTEHIPMPSR
jgi:hypothetical protein